MGKLVSKDILQTRPPSLQIKPVAGWSWYCSYHDTYGIGDEEEEVNFYAGAHLHYNGGLENECSIWIKEHQAREEA